MAAEASGVDLLKSPVRRRILGLLHAYAGGEDAEHGGLTAHQLAEMLDMHVTSVRFHLDQLVEGELVVTQTVRREKVGRPHKLYLAAPGSLQSVHQDNHAYEVLAGLLATVLIRQSQTGEALTPEEAGMEWARQHVESKDEPPAATAGQWLSKIGQMVDVLHEWGYTPDVATSQEGRSAEVRLVNCPVIALAKTNPAVVCGVHRGLIIGSMHQLGETDAQVTLQPFVTPTVCLAHVSTTTPFQVRKGPAPTSPGSDT